MHVGRTRHGERPSLPVSGARVGLRPMTGDAELLLAERGANDPTLPLALLQQLGEAKAQLAWDALPVHDVDTLIVRLRQAQMGDRIVAEVACGRADCGERVDLSFGLAAYLEHHRPRPLRRRGWAVASCAEATDWYRCTADGIETVRFRLPTLADQIAVAGAPDETKALAGRCIRPNGLPARARQRAEAAMAALAPPLAGSLQGRCPACGATIEAWFEARRYCLQELCARARYVFDDIDLLAERYHWSERAILRLPCGRRERYAERVRLARAA